MAAGVRTGGGFNGATAIKILVPIGLLATWYFFGGVAALWALLAFFVVGFAFLTAFGANETR